MPPALTDALTDRTVLALVGCAYLAGSIPFGFILAKMVAGKDVRAAGSGNIGATNVARVVGKKLGVVTLILDALKGFVPVAVAAHALDQGPLVVNLVACAAVVGHCFPIWLLFRGGKGVATGLGVLLAARPIEAGIGVAVFAVSFAVLRKVSAGSLIAAAAVVIALAVRGPLDVTIAPLAVCFAIIFGKHHGNIRRLVTGTELKV